MAIFIGSCSRKDFISVSFFYFTSSRFYLLSYFLPHALAVHSAIIETSAQRELPRLARISNPTNVDEGFKSTRLFALDSSCSFPEKNKINKNRVGMVVESEKSFKKNLALDKLEPNRIENHILENNIKANPGSTTMSDKSSEVLSPGPGNSKVNRGQNYKAQSEETIEDLIPVKKSEQGLENSWDAPKIQKSFRRSKSRLGKKPEFLHEKNS
ncbi:expressed protein [Phakopsora pachyrhizi]|uniref:Expressed protein n=1 Tax=Phakopsora pachyrhizi TaxID=170000 RepID=A0AAV0APZ8_PHAPC|nr:expressed protein [Phakopsora pachyrhizi]